MRLLISSVLLLVAGCASSQERLSDAISVLRKGMTRQEVCDSLGYANRISYKDNMTIWIYRFADDRDRLGYVVNGTSPRANARFLALAFDRDGILQSWETD